MLQGLGGNVTIEETGEAGTTMLVLIPVMEVGKDVSK